MGGDIVDSRPPWIIRGAMARPLLESAYGPRDRTEIVDALAVAARKGRRKISHIELRIRIALRNDQDERGAETLYPTGRRQRLITSSKVPAGPRATDHSTFMASRLSLLRLAIYRDSA